MDFGFSNIEITNFRGIDYLEIGGLAPVNVFVGANNVGKTSVLEAVFMLSGLSNPQMPTRVNYLRSVLQESVDSARYLFHNLDFGNMPLLKAGAEGGDRWLTFAPVMADNTEASAGLSFTHSEIARLDFDFGIGGQQFHSTLYSAGDGKIKQTRPEGYAEKIRCLFIPADKNDKGAVANFSTLVKRNGRQPVVDALRDFDPAIESVEALPDGLYLKLAGVGELLPVSMAGDGVRRAVNILSVVANEDYNMVLVDEFDNGLDTLAAVLRGARFPVVSSNYVFDHAGMANLVKPYVVVERGGLRIGIMAVNVNPEGLVMQANYRGMQWLDPVGVANETADYLKGRLGCDLVICLSHLGADEARFEPNDFSLARRSRHIDVVIGGHSHELIADTTATNLDGRAVIIAQAGKSGAYLGRIDLVLER